MSSRFRLAGLAVCMALPAMFAGAANADHNSHWFYDSYNQYEVETFNYYVPRRLQRRRPAVVYEDPDYLYEEGYISEREYRRLLRAERRKARRLRAKRLRERRKAQRKKRWRKREVRYDLAAKNSKLRKRRQPTNVPLPRARPITGDFANSNRVVADPVETATLGPAPVTVAPIEPAPRRTETQTEATKAVEPRTPEPQPVEKVETKPVKKVETKPAKKVETKPAKKALSAPAEEPVSKPAAKKKVAAIDMDKKVKGRISCRSAQKIVAGFGFTDIEARSCSGNNYDFAARRDGKPFTITLSSKNGELTEVKRN